uniref:Opsin 3 n=1 Tax=Leptobrachium leishanense TaxID=445787 RepID=A0A8C5LUC7_9ANUR
NKYVSGIKTFYDTPFYFYQDTYDLLALAMASLGIFGLCSNLLMLILYYKCQGLRTPSNLLLVNIGVSNVLSSIFGASFTFMCFFLIKVYELFFRYTLVTMLHVYICFAGLVSSFTLTVLAYERYSRVIHDKIIDFSWTWRAVVCIWLYSWLWAVVPLIGWNRYTFENHGLDCALNWMPNGPNELSFVLTFVLACISELFFYTCLFQLVLASDLQAVQVIKIINYEKYMIKISVVMVLEFLCYWMPYAVISLLTISGFDRLTTPTNTLVPLFISKSVAASNPVIYIFVNRKVCFFFGWGEVFFEVVKKCYNKALKEG